MITVIVALRISCLLMISDLTFPFPFALRRMQQGISSPGKAAVIVFLTALVPSIVGNLTPDINLTYKCDSA